MHILCMCIVIVIFITDGTSISLSHHYPNHTNYDATINNSDNINSVKKFDLIISGQKRYKDTEVPISSLLFIKGMPARSHHK